MLDLEKLSATCDFIEKNFGDKEFCKREYDYAVHHAPKEERDNLYTVLAMRTNGLIKVARVEYFELPKRVLDNIGEDAYDYFANGKKIENWRDAETLREFGVEIEQRPTKISGKRFYYSMDNLFETKCRRNAYGTYAEWVVGAEKKIAKYQAKIDAYKKVMEQLEKAE